MSLDAPPISYATAPDGASVAYWTIGSGPPLIYLHAITSNIEMEWEVEETRSWYLRLAEEFTLVRFDPRGTGLSDRSDQYHLTVADVSEDLLAVLERAGIQRATVFSGDGASASEAVVFAAQRPDLVSSLILWAPDSGLSAAIKLLTPLREQNPRLFSETVLLWRGWFEQKSRERMIRLREAARSPATYEHYLRQRDAHTAEAERHAIAVTVPSLILFRRDRLLGPADSAVHFSRVIPGARRMVLAGFEDAPELGDTDAVLEAITTFVEQSGGEPSPSMPGSGFQTILFTDLESSTALTQRLGDEAAQDVLRGHNSTVRSALEANGGREVKHTGDGIMASFGSAVSAVTAAIEIQRELAGGEIRVRIGINAGEPIAEDNDLFGTAVQLAARITDRAEPGQVLVSDVVRQLCAGKAFEFTSVGAANLKGFDDPVTLLEARPG